MREGLLKRLTVRGYWIHIFSDVRRWDRLQSKAEENRDAPESRNLLELGVLHVERAWVNVAIDQMNMAPSWRRFLMVASIAIGLALCGSVVLPFLTGSSNCGGNSAALAACSSISTSFQVISADRGDRPVAISDLSASERENFGQVSGLGWLGKSRVLVTPAKIGCGGREIVAVCDAAFDNVPRRLFGKAPPTHAVAYANGTTGLLREEEFRRLNLNGFVDVRSIQPRKVKEDGAANGD